MKHERKFLKMLTEKDTYISERQELQESPHLAQHWSKYVLKKRFKFKRFNNSDG